MLRLPRPLLRLLLLGMSILGLADADASAQAPRRGDRISVRTGTALRAAPDGDVIGVSRRTITGTVEQAQGRFVRLTLDGHLPATAVRLTADRRRGEVTPADGARLRLRADARAEVVAELHRGTFVFPARAGARFPAGRTGMLAVRRVLWVDASRVSRMGGAAAAAPAKSPAARTGAARTGAAPTSGQADEGRLDSLRPDSVRRDIVRRDSATRAVAGGGPTLETRGPTTLRAGPGGDVVATIPGGVGLRSLAREDGWVRVRLEGWLPDSVLEAAGARAEGSLTAADLRANPMGTVGRLVRWRVESLALRTADDLRQGLAPGERYLLARGPGAERVVLYLVVPDALLPTARALPPLAEVAITARVRTGRSRPAGVPILELLELSRR